MNVMCRVEHKREKGEQSLEGISPKKTCLLTQYPEGDEMVRVVVP